MNNNDPKLPEYEEKFLNGLEDKAARQFTSFLRANLHGPYQLYFTNTGPSGDLRIRTSRDTKPFVLLTLVWRPQDRCFEADLRCDPGVCEGRGFLTVVRSNDAQMDTTVTFNTDKQNIDKLIGVLPACDAALKAHPR